MLVQKMAYKRPIVDDLKTVFSPSATAEGTIVLILWIVGGFWSMLVVGALYGFRTAYKKLRQKIGDELGPPTLNGQPWAVYISMIAWAVIFFFLPAVLLYLYASVISSLFDNGYNDSIPYAYLLGLMVVNFIVTFIAMSMFRKWRDQEQTFFNEKGRHGTARFAYDSEIEPYRFSGKRRRLPVLAA